MSANIMPSCNSLSGLSCYEFITFHCFSCCGVNLALGICYLVADLLVGSSITSVLYYIIILKE